MEWALIAVACAVPALAPAFAKRWGAALWISIITFGTMMFGLLLAWPALLIVGWVIAHRAEKADRD